ncbi:3'-5' exonuclease [Clostridium sp. KNHs216]|uniref:3'-5' exonuclease n=1 Tax=Clostridium sp. KNHs216 TaxID=1550235 RepID=UPI001A9BDBEE|nr:3'-5' exonuclease [Clostridium sp. KNHs216]
MNEYVALDFETTGLDKAFDRIIEIAAIKYVNGSETDKYVTLVNPQRPIPAEAQAVNHISNRIVANAPTEDIAVPQLIDFLGDSLIVGHNINFDLGFLEIAAQRCGQNVEYHYIDTISVSKKISPGLENYKLETIAKCMRFDTSKLHRAEADVRVCAEIITVALDSLEARSAINQ